MSVIIG